MKNFKTKKITVEVAIAAYNAEKNIESLVRSLVSQKQISYNLSQVIVNSDVSSDKTVVNAKKVKSKLVYISDSKERKGFAGTLVSLIQSSKKDVLIILNDDIIIKDSLFIEKTIHPFLSGEKIGLVCCNAQAFKSNNFVSEAVRAGYNPYKRISEETRGGNNVFTVDGKALCLSSEFMKSIKFPNDYTIMGNVDKYIYFTCIKNNFKYIYVKNAIMYFKCPQTVKDFVKWQTRNYKSNKYLVRKAWGKLVDKEYQMSTNKFRYYKLLEFMTNPLGSLLILGLGLYSSMKAKLDSKNFETTWDTVQTTKDL